MEGDSRVYQVKPACSNEGRWERDEWFGWGILTDVGAGSKDGVKHVGRIDEWLWVMMMVWWEWHKVKSVCC